MVRRSKGFRTKTRKKLKKEYKKRGISRFLQEFEMDERVLIKIDPSSHKGMPHPRFHGKIGRVIGRRGNAYILIVRDGNSYKKIISNPEHLVRVKQ